MLTGNLGTFSSKSSTSQGFHITWWTWGRHPKLLSHDDVITWKHFPRNWPFVRGFHQFPAQRPVTRSFDVFFDLRLNKRLSKQSWGWWFETPPWSLWRQCNWYPTIYRVLIRICNHYQNCDTINKNIENYNVRIGVVVFFININCITDWCTQVSIDDIDSLVQGCSISRALALKSVLH